MKKANYIAFATCNPHDDAELPSKRKVNLTLSDCTFGSAGVRCRGFRPADGMVPRAPCMVWLTYHHEFYITARESYR